MQKLYNSPMSLTSKIILLHFLVLITGICWADTLVSRLPTTAIEASCTEEMWVYLAKPIPSGSLYIFYQQDASRVELTATDVKLKFLYYEPPIGASLTSPVFSKGKGKLEKVIEFNRWMHIAVTKNLKPTGSADPIAVIYVNDKSSAEITLPPDLLRVSFQTNDRNCITRST
eukprot:TRINITY_DN16963_c0_g1_i2.p1 TRINITY_DN16963_c0_g1~~TRINITY_DN16963_c0_g1_i2.p1  ORF type:complete len:172 (-),score=22.78 TRINITY_DN16963_c0_g1_i2:240-755(-)